MHEIATALRVSRAETRLTVYRAPYIRKLCQLVPKNSGLRQLVTFAMFGEEK